MAATTESVKADAAEAPLLNKRNLILGMLLYFVFYSWVRWYEGVYGWSAGLDSFAPEFETYWMNFLYIELVLEVVVADAKMTKNALPILLSMLLLFTIFSLLLLPKSSSVITICWSTPVPIAAIIPAILGKSRFHLINAAIPRIMMTSLRLVNVTGIAILSFL